MDRTTLILLVLLIAPLPLVAIVAMIRRYEISLTLRPRRNRRNDQP